jgi:hypothetical protein
VVVVQIRRSQSLFRFRKLWISQDCPLTRSLNRLSGVSGGAIEQVAGAISVMVASVAVSVKRDFPEDQKGQFLYLKQAD